MMLLALDPSLACSGWALFYGPELFSCGIAPTETRWSYSARITELARTLAREIPPRKRIDKVVVEWPVIYEGEARKGRPEDLLWLAAVAGAALCEVTPGVVLDLVKPSEWKGQVEKKVHNDRVLKRLNTAELDILNSSVTITSLRHNAIDAIGIGLKALGRMEAKRGETLSSGKIVSAGRRAKG